MPYAKKSQRAAYNRKYRQKNKTDLQRKHNQYWRQRPEKVLDKYLKTTYGISFVDYAMQLYRQRGVCAICQKPCPSGKRLAVDHNHETGELRGLLCINCNVALAQAEKPGWTQAAERYLNG